MPHDAAVPPTLETVGDTWGREGPPDEAYSRVSRDLAVVTAGFTAFLDGLPGRLATAFDCTVREPTAEELARLRRLSGLQLDEAYVVEPADPASATLLVGRGTFEHGAFAVLGLGRGTDALVPTCFCDACDEDSESLADQVEELLAVVTGGFHEFRRPAPAGLVRRRGARRRTEQGFEWRGGSSVGGGPDGGEPYDARWRAWPRRGSAA